MDRKDRGALEEHGGLLRERARLGSLEGGGGELVQYKAGGQFPLGPLCLV